MKQKYDHWLVVSDIDGTLNTKFRKLPANNSNAIKAFTENGGNFTLASGRMVSSLKRHYSCVAANQPAIVINGAGIYDYQQGKMLWRSTIGEKGRAFVKDVLSKFNTPLNSVDVGVFFDDHVYIIRKGLLSQGQMYFDKSEYEIARLSDVPQTGWMKVIFWSNPVVIRRLKKYIDSIENPDANFMFSSPWSLEMLQKGTHKGAAVLHLAEMLGIEKDHIAAIGDYYNDYDMLKSVGLPACAGQAPKALHQVAKYEACHCNKGCVADLLRYIMFHNGGISSE